MVNHLFFCWNKNVFRRFPPPAQGKKNLDLKHVQIHNLPFEISNYCATESRKLFKILIQFQIIRTIRFWIFNKLITHAYICTYMYVGNIFPYRQSSIVNHQLSIICKLLVFFIAADSFNYLPIQIHMYMCTHFLNCSLSH